MTSLEKCPHVLYSYFDSVVLRRSHDFDWASFHYKIAKWPHLSLECEWSETVDKVQFFIRNHTIWKVGFSTKRSSTWLTDRCRWRRNDGRKSVIGSGKGWCSVRIEVGGFEAIKAEGVLFASNVEEKVLVMALKNFERISIVANKNRVTGR